MGTFRTVSDGSLVRAVKVLRDSLLDPSRTLDAVIGSIAIVTGIWMIRGGILRYPNILREMISMAPIGVWGGLLIVKGMLSIAAVEFGWRSLLVACHIVGFSLWIFLWRFFAVGLVPPEMCYVSGVMAAAVFARLLQIPKAGD